MDVFSIGSSYLGRDIYCVRLTNENITHEKPKVLFVGYHHGRERISAELPLYFVVNATTGYGVNVTVTRLLNLSEIYVIVALNVDAFDVLASNDWQRTNLHPFDYDEDGLFDEDPPDDEDGDGFVELLWHQEGPFRVPDTLEGTDDDNDGLWNEDWVGGVDINRNYGFAWNASGSSPWGDDYPGPAPFSEPETQVMRDFAMQHDFEYAISFHSGTEYILYPWTHTTVPTVDDQKFRAIASDLAMLVNASYGQASEELYEAYGTWDDWMYGNRSTYAFTCEIFYNDTAWHHEKVNETSWWARELFNPDPSEIKTVITRWLPVFTYISNKAIEEFWPYQQFGPRADRLLIKLYLSAEAEWSALEMGEIDITDWPLTESYYERFTTPPQSEIIESISHGAEFSLFLLDINWNNNEYLGNPPDPAYLNPCIRTPVALSASDKLYGT